MKIYLNGRLVDERRATVSVFDRGFLYGDGIYETLQVMRGVILDADDHLRRLERSARGIGIRLPWSRVFLKKAMLQTVHANRADELTLRMTVTRGVGPVGNDPRLAKKPTLVIMPDLRRYAADQYEQGTAIVIAKTRRNHPLSLNPAIKSTNHLNNILAKAEANAAGATEAVMLNTQGHLAEGTISNVFFVKNGVLHTPALHCGLLQGVTRTRVLHLARQAGVRIKEGQFRAEALLSAHEVFLTGTVRGVMPVTRVNGRRIGRGRPGPMTLHLAALYRGFLQKKIGF